MELDRPEPDTQQFVDHCLAVPRGIDGRSARAAPDAVSLPAEHVRDGKVFGSRSEIPECYVHDPDDGEMQADTERAPERSEDARPIERVRARKKRRGRFFDGGDHRADGQFSRPCERRAWLSGIAVEGQQHSLHVHGPAASPSETAAEAVSFNRHIGNLHGRSPFVIGLASFGAHPESRAVEPHHAASPMRERTAIPVPPNGGFATRDAGPECTVFTVCPLRPFTDGLSPGQRKL